ncbi:MAG: isochorismatase family protein [Acidimicrobiales bacterium]|nr:isochorismatase family protein [Actinomycetota bacterium]
MNGWVAGTEPYAWPYDGRLHGHHLALVLAGWDEGWRGRAGPTADAPVAQRTLQLAAAVAAHGGLVVAVAHGSAHLSLAVPHRVANAAGLDGFFGGPLDHLLRAEGRTHLLVAGHGIEGPVHSTLRAANDRGYECLLVVDACTALVADLAPAAAKTVTMSGGIFGAVGTVAAVLDAVAPTDRPTPSPTAQEA